MLIRYIIFWKLFRICCFDFMSLPCHRGKGLLTRSNRKARCCLVGSDDACEDPLRSARRWVKLVSCLHFDDKEMRWASARRNGSRIFRSEIRSVRAKSESSMASMASWHHHLL